MNDNQEQVIKDEQVLNNKQEANDVNKIQKQEENILKVRDDHEPIYLEVSGDYTYRIVKGKPFSLSQTKDQLTLKDLRERIEPWLTSLFQSEHLSVLIGSGLSTAILNIATKSSSLFKSINELRSVDTQEEFQEEPQKESQKESQMEATDSNSDSAKQTINAMGVPNLTGCPFADEIKEAVAASAKKNGRGEGNIEDYIRVINDLLRGLEIMKDTTKYDSLYEKKVEIISKFTSDIFNIERSIAEANEENKTLAFNYLVTFLMSFASRTGTRERLHIFTTNYDRVIEAGAELAGLHLLDRFVGILSPIFRSSRLDIDMHYNPPGIRGEPRYLEGVAKFTKLHGSIDWIMSNNEIRKIGLPFGAMNIAPYLKAPGLNVDSTQIMIYPNSSKDRETAEYPYVELFRDFAAALCRPNSTLVTYGYSFGDEHINRIIRDMLTIPSTHLVIIAYKDVLGRIMKTYQEIGRPSQISLIIGPKLADIEILTNYFLPKPSIDRATIRMNELLKKRYSVTISTEDQPTDNFGGGDEI